MGLSSLEALLSLYQDRVMCRNTQQGLQDTAEEGGQGTRAVAVKEHLSDESARQCCDLLVIFGHEHDPGFYCVIFFSGARKPTFYWSVP